MTDLHRAATGGRALRLEQLIEAGDSVNIATMDNVTPLHEACMQDHPSCARLLLEAGAWVDVWDIRGRTPLCYACSSGSLECAKLLLDYGAKVNPSLTALTASPLHKIYMRGAVKFYKTALHHAARLNKVDMMELLVEFGANVYASDNRGRKPVDYTTPASPSYTCLRFYESNPLSLQQLCRITVRKTLGTRASKAIDQLNIPSSIHSYLQYCDLIPKKYPGLHVPVV
ncbi:ankyrin repeat and SOCS box protein 13-like [Anabas testudineus]|uniref:ankyrin repeat and SOCS box protein 13-like n=1 Tax=Anabas testudineus TaxID=64144 RepID=UPI000E45F735|nr:ankyrin repeat and SOCS box protein 13-like [Anabas testudineus]